MARATFARCGYCANRCRIRLTLADTDVVEEARRAVPRKGGFDYEPCPNIARAEGLSFSQAKGLLNIA